MKTYKVLWCDIHNTCGGCVDVIAKNEQDAIVKARKIVQLGCNFQLVNIYATK